MVRFLRSWLVPILAGLLLIGIAIAFIPFSRQMETRAKTELTLLMDRAFARIDAEDRLAEPMIAAEEENLLSKAAAVSRFLTHDDTLLASDALTALCQQLSIDRIDVANLEGTLIASSDATSIGSTLGAQEAFRWTMEAADDPTATLTQQDKTDPNVLYACVGRSDIEGFVLLTRSDAHVKSALALAGAESVTSDMPYGGDVLFPAEAGADGFFYESGNLCLRRTQSDVTLIAARPTTEVFAVRTAAILAFGAALACIMICGVAAYLLRLEPVAAMDEDETLSLDEATAQDDAVPEAQEQQQEQEQKRKRRKSPRAREQDEEEVLAEAVAEVEHEHEQALEHAPRQVIRGKKHAYDAIPEKNKLRQDEDGFEKIVE